MTQDYIITVFSENKVGLLNQITTVLICRNVNIESLTTSESSIPGINKFTIVVNTDADKIKKLSEQLEKKVEVLKVFVYTNDEVVRQEIALYKVPRSSSIETLIRENNVRVLEVTDEYIVLEKTGHKEETQELLEKLQLNSGIHQFVRSGEVAVIKSKHELLDEYLAYVEEIRLKKEKERKTANN